MDRGAWWATVRKVAKSQTLLRRLSTHTKILNLILDLYIFLFYNMCLWGLKYYLQTAPRLVTPLYSTNKHYTSIVFLKVSFEIS